MLELFVNTLTADDKYSLLNRHNLLPNIYMQLSHKQKKIFSVFLHFRNRDLILNIFKQKMNLIAHICLMNLRP